MTNYKRILGSLTPSDEIMDKIENVPHLTPKAKNFKLKKAIVLAVAVMLLAAFSTVTAYAATELYGWQLLEKEVADRGGTVTARYYENGDKNGRLKVMEYEYDSIYFHFHGKAWLEDDGFIVANEDAELKEEYAYLAQGDDSGDSGYLGYSFYAGDAP